MLWVCLSGDLGFLTLQEGGKVSHTLFRSYAKKKGKSVWMKIRDWETTFVFGGAFPYPERGGKGGADEEPKSGLDSQERSQRKVRKEWGAQGVRVQANVRQAQGKC